MTTLNFGDFRLQQPRAQKRPPCFESVVRTAMRLGFVIGREVLVGKIPGIVAGYNIGSFGRFPGTAYPLVVRTEMGVAKCHPDELTLV